MSSAYRYARNYMSREDIMIFSIECDRFFDYIDSRVCPPEVKRLFLEGIKSTFARALEAAEDMSYDEVGSKDELYCHMEKKLVEFRNKIIQLNPCCARR